MATESSLGLAVGRTTPVVFPKRNPALLAFADFKESNRKWRVWLMLAYHDIKLRYRRSVLGPFWITISMAITVYTMGFLYGHLFRTRLMDYFPFLVAGMLSWSLIASGINEVTDAFTSYDGLIKQLKLPYTLHIYRIISRNIIIFIHNLVIMAPVYFFFHETAQINLNTLFLIPALVIIFINCLFLGLLLAMFAARFRDISPIIKSIIQIIFFMTPVMWNPTILPANKLYFVSYNPFYSFVELLRQPLMGKLPATSLIITTLLITLIGIFISFNLFVRYRSRIIYWL